MLNEDMKKIIEYLKIEQDSLARKKLAEDKENWQAANAAKDKEITLNNLAVASVLAKEYKTAFQAWKRQLKVNPTSEYAVQKLGLVMEMVQNRQIVLKGDALEKIADLYVTVINASDAEFNEDVGFLFMYPPSDEFENDEISKFFIQKDRNHLPIDAPYEWKYVRKR